MASDKDLIRKLREIQEQQQFTDGQMADKLGCTRQLYQATKTGKIPVGLTILRGTTRAFPELTGDALIFLTGDVDIRAKTVGIRTTTPEMHPGFSTRFRRWLRSCYLRIRHLRNWRK